MSTLRNQLEQSLEVEGGGKNIAPAAPRAITPMDMIQQAVASGAGLEMVEKLMTLQERWEANNARKAFNEAFAAFKAEAVTVVRNRKVTDGPLKDKSYAELFSFVDAATPALSKHGLSHSWKITRDEKDWIEVTCIIEHELGGNKRVSLGGPPDAGGAKNALQARISTVTYLERATFKAATGLAEQGDDNDGRGGGAPTGTVTDKQRDELADLIETSGTDIVKFCGLIGVEALSDVLAKDFEGVKLILTQKKAVAKLKEGKS